MLDEDKLYEKLQKESIPFFRWSKWLESILQREIITMLISKSDKS